MVFRTSGKRWAAMLLILAMVLSVAPAGVAKTQASDDFNATNLLEFAKKITGLIRIMDPEDAGIEVIDWEVDMLEYIFGFGGDNPMSSDDNAYFEAILIKMDELLKSIKDLQKSMEAQELANLINYFDANLVKAISGDVYDRFYDIGRSDMTKDRKRIEYLGALTDGFGIHAGEWGTITCSFDDYAEELAKVMLSTFEVTLDNTPQSKLFLEAVYEYMRMKYRWEHQGLEEWQTIQARAITLLVETLTIEKYSLEARLELIREYNTDHPDKPLSEGLVPSRLKDVQGWLNTAHEMYFENTDWMPKSHDPENERYYWHRQHPILFGARVTTQHIPQEDSTRFGYEGQTHPRYIKGIDKDSYWGSVYSVWSFWKPFFRPVRMLYESEARAIFADFGGSKSFYDIFLSPDEGNIQGLEGTSNKWKLIIDTKDHHLDVSTGGGSGKPWYYYVQGCFMDALQTGACPDAKPMHIIEYYYDHNVPYTGTEFIGIHVISGLPDTLEDEGVYLGSHMETPLGWTALDGDLSISLDVEQGRPVSVTADGKRVSARNYIASDSAVRLTTAYLSKLSKGFHTFVVTAENGSMTLTMNIGEHTMLILPKSLQTIEDGAFAGIASEYVAFDEACTEIGAGAFAGCRNLVRAYLPGSVTIGEGAFSNCPKLEFICPNDSPAAAYAEANGIPHRVRGI